MKPEDKTKFCAVIKYLDECFPDRNIDAQGIEIYFDALSSYDVDDIFRAAKMYVQKGCRFPLVSDLVSLI